jgi:methyl-accepting chemotaxis protein
MNFSIKTKLLIILLVACVSVSVAGGLGLRGMQLANGSLESMYRENLKDTSDISTIMVLMSDNRIQLLLALQHDPAKPDINRMHDHQLTVHTDQVIKNNEKIAAIWKDFISNRSLSPSEKKIADDYADKLKILTSEGLLATRAALLAGKFEDALQITITRSNPLFKLANEAAQQLSHEEKEEATKVHAKAVSNYHATLVCVVAAIILSILVTLVLGIIIFRSITNSAAKLIKASQCLAQGDLSQRAQLVTHDEFEIIGQSFDVMADSISHAIRKVSEASSQVSVASEQVNSTAKKIAYGAEEVANQTATVATAGDEMSVTSGTIAQNCQFAADGAKQASQSAHNGAAVVEGTIAVMGLIAEKVQESARTVAGLGARSDQIGAIINTIEDIADQTNLLALNAAIEAARAGEQGRGFAVVADEVRALAERTTHATKEIDAMIKAIQNQTKGAVAAMEQGVRQVESGTVEAAKSGDALRDILQQVNSVAAQIHQIAISADEQTATACEISCNINKITYVVHETAQSAHQSASAASQLRTNAEELQRLVCEFKL